MSDTNDQLDAEVFRAMCRDGYQLGLAFERYGGMLKITFSLTMATAGMFNDRFGVAVPDHAAAEAKRQKNAVMEMLQSTPRAILDAALAEFAKEKKNV